MLNAGKHLLMLAVMALIWLVLGMVYFDRFIPPFDSLRLWLMPWKGLQSIPPEAGLVGRLSFMEELFDASTRVAKVSFSTMVLSFGALGVYLTYLYQQKQRRAQENRMLLMKNQEIAVRNEFIRYISATISHEFKNNLGRIKRRLDLLRGLPAEVKERIDDNMDKLFADIEIFKKISDGREAGVIDFDRLQLRQMLEGLSGQYGDLAEITLEESQKPPLTVFASQTLLRTVFENLIDNSVKYKKPEQGRARIRLSCSEDLDGSRRYVSLSFRDEGVGMDEKQAAECFYKDKKAVTTGNGEGWGQGLYFVKYAVGLHAGKVRVGMEYTRPGVGTEIIINLPLIEETYSV